MEIFCEKKWEECLALLAQDLLKSYSSHAYTEPSAVRKVNLFWNGIPSKQWEIVGCYELQLYVIRMLCGVNI